MSSVTYIQPADRIAAYNHQTQNTENITTTKNYITSKACKLQQHGRPCKFILNRKASIVDQIKCFIMNNISFLAPKSWFEQLLQKADGIQYRTTDKFKCLINTVAIYEDMDTFNPDSKPPVLLSKSNNSNNSEYLHTLSCYDLEAFKFHGIIGKDKFKSIDTEEKFHNYCCDNLTEINNILDDGDDDDDDDYDYDYDEIEANVATVANKIDFSKGNFREVLESIVQIVATQKTGYKTVYRWKIGFKFQKPLAKFKNIDSEDLDKPKHSMLLSFSKKQDAVVISLYDPTNSIDTVRFVVNNKNAIAKIKFTDFFPVLLQKTIYNLDKKYENNLYIRV